MCGFLRISITSGAKNQEYHYGTHSAWPSGKIPSVETSSYAGRIRAIFYGFDTARF